MNLPYEPPHILPLNQTQVAPYPYDPSQIASWMLQHGPTLMLTHENRLRNNYQNLKHLFNQSKIPCQLVYPYKVNHTAAIIAIMHEEGAFAGLCCDHEMALAKKLGVDGQKMMLSGPVKSDGLLLDALEQSALIHIDHIEELTRLEQITTQTKQQARVSLQITGFSAQASQFGFEKESTHLRSALAIIGKSPYLNCIGLYHHHHEQNPTEFTKVIEGLCDFATRCHDQGVYPKQLFLGGGFPASVPQKQANLSASAATKHFSHVLQRYASKIIQAFGHHVSIQIAPGRLLVEDAVDCACKVMAIKPRQQGIDTVFLSVGQYLLPYTKWYRHPIRILSPSSLDRMQNYRICGPSSLHHDIIRQSIKLPALQVNDTLIIERIGAYHQSHAAHRAENQAATILIHGNKNHLIQKAQSVEHMLAHDLIPSHLRHAHQHLG